MDKSKKIIGEFHCEREIIGYYPLTNNYYLIKEKEKSEGAYRPTYYLCDTNNNVVETISAGYNNDLKIIDNSVILWNANKNEFLSFNSDNTWEQVTGFYHDCTGIHKGTIPNELESENNPGTLTYQEILATLGTKEDIILKKNPETKSWKLLDKNGNALYDDRYLAETYSSHYNFFFLAKEDSTVCIIDRNANIVSDDGTFTWNDLNTSAPDFMGSSLYYDSIFDDSTSLYIVRENQGSYDVYQFGTSNSK